MFSTGQLVPRDFHSASIEGIPHVGDDSAYIPVPSQFSALIKRICCRMIHYLMIIVHGLVL